MKRILRRIAAGILLFTITLSSVQVFAASGHKIVIDGKEAALNSPVYLLGGYNFVPMGEIMRLLGADVEWNGAAATVTATKDDKEILVTIGSNEAIVDGKKVLMDAPAQIINNFTYVPVAFVGKALGYAVEWNGDINTVTLRTPTVQGVDVSFKHRYETDLTFDEAYKRAFSQSNKVKTLTSNMEIANISRDEIVNQYTFATVNSTYVPGIDISDSIRKILSSVSKTDTNIKNEPYNKMLLEGALALQIKNSFNSIVSAQNTIALSEASLELDKRELEQEKLKLELGMVSEVSYQAKKIAYEKKLEDQRINESALEADYQSLNKLLAYDAEKRYNVILDDEYVPLDKNFLLENYVISAVSKDPNVKIAENALYQAQRDKDFSTASTNSEYLSTISAIEAADRDLDDTKKTVASNVRDGYKNLRDLESKIASGELDLAQALTNVEVAKVNFSAGNSTELDVMKAIFAADTAEKSLEAYKYTYNLLKYRFENPYLLGMS